MAYKKLKTYDCTLSFSFSTKDDDFMNPDFDFGHISVVCDFSNGCLIHLFGNSEAKHPIIISGVHNVLFSCAPIDMVDITAEDLLKSILTHQGLESLGDCVFCYQPIKGSRFFLGVKEKELFNGLSKEDEKKLVAEKFPQRSRRKKS